jgi:hypothetical protein
MLISELSLRSLIREMLIIEGYKDDQRALIEKYPDSATTINQLKPKWIGWLASRFLVEPLTEVHPFEDAIVTVKLFTSTPAPGYASIVLAAHIYKNFPRFLDLFPVYGLLRVERQSGELEIMGVASDEDPIKGFVKLVRLP